jgi:hypothetical protein
MFFSVSPLELQKINIVNRTDELSLNSKKMLETLFISHQFNEKLVEKIDREVATLKAEIASESSPEQCSNLFRSFTDEIVKVNKEIDWFNEFSRKHLKRCNDVILFKSAQAYSDISPKSENDNTSSFMDSIKQYFGY